MTAHLAHPPSRIERVEARVIGFDTQWLRLRWKFEGAGALVVPSFAGKGRADGLWRTTCFEMFLRPEGGARYCEFNLSPSERWAAYDFVSYRAGMSERPLPREPVCTMRQGQSVAIFDAAIPAAAIPGGTSAMALTAVLEEEAGNLSYWAARHPAEKPDFHDAACFTAAFTAPEDV